MTCRTLLLLLTVGARVAGAQDATLSGRVVRATDGVPVVGAEVLAPGVPRNTRSDSAGRYRLDSLPAGNQLIVVSTSGFVPESSWVLIGRGEVVVQDLSLVRVSRLPLETIEERTDPRAGRLADFRERRRMGIGWFIDRGDLDGRNGQRLETILSKAPGVSVSRGTGMKAWLSSRRAVSSGKCAMCRESALDVLDRADFEAGARLACYLDVYLDGALVYNSAARQVPLFNLNSLDPGSIEALEIYSSGARVPAQFNRTAANCGVLLIWTRSSPP